MPASGAIKLLDANVWLALAYRDHVHHGSASQWFDQQSEQSCAFCRITQPALLRLLTNRHVMGPFVQTQQRAWQEFDAFSRDPRVFFLGEPIGLEVPFRNFANSQSPSHSNWTDSYRAAFATAADLRFVTFDTGLSRFPQLQFELLS